MLQQSQKKNYNLSGKANISKDMMTSLSYNLRFGVVITYFNGNFRLFDSITY